MQGLIAIVGIILTRMTIPASSLVLVEKWSEISGLLQSSGNEVLRQSGMEHA